MNGFKNWDNEDEHFWVCIDQSEEDEGDADGGKIVILFKHNKFFYFYWRPSQEANATTQTSGGET